MRAGIKRFDGDLAACYNARRVGAYACRCSEELQDMDLSPFAPYLSVIEIVLALVMIVLIVLQSKGSDLGGFLGGDTSATFRTKRGVEATMHRLTIYFGIAFFVVTLLTFIAVGQQ